MKPKIFIDGEVGTTGLQIRERLAGRADIEMLSIDPARRKDDTARADKLNGADIVILCLPDDAARAAVKLITNPAVRVIDASTAHRTADGWTYGFPELSRHHRQEIAAAQRVTNPGCWATGATALIRPLVDAGLLASDYPVTIGGISGYSGGGKAMIAEFEDKNDPTYTTVPYRIYGLDLRHKHVPEIQKYARLGVRPLFTPAVGRYAQGMIVEVPLYLSLLSGKPTAADLHRVIADAYSGAAFIEVVPLSASRTMKTLTPEDLNGSNRMKLFVFASEAGDQVRLAALLDNLGKGASGQAVQNMNIMLGFPETTALG
ncbi:MAG: N-acetyl-gamma-glutamyl-phosphate reductase [Rhodospirillaceae bacterium]|nr:MAG: N-acetyl-gamma-glutamyl-phosphate reductase [Rhodospirillaceae bacterium]